MKRFIKILLLTQEDSKGCGYYRAVFSTTEFQVGDHIPLSPTEKLWVEVVDRQIHIYSGYVEVMVSSVITQEGLEELALGGWTYRRKGDVVPDTLWSPSATPPALRFEAATWQG